MIEFVKLLERSIRNCEPLSLRLQMELLSAGWLAEDCALTEHESGYSPAGHRGETLPRRGQGSFNSSICFVCVNDGVADFIRVLVVYL